MRRLLAATATVSLLAAAGPALAAPATHGACNAPDGAIVLKAGGEGYEEVVSTPVGVFNSGSQEVGSFYVDLSGKPAADKGKLKLTLSWDAPGTDYDLVVNGTNEESVDNPEVLSVKAAHCKKIEVAVEVWLGAPVEELTLTAKA